MFQGLFSDRVFYRKLMKLALPLAFQSLMLAAVAAADALMLGNVEQNMMASVSLASQVQFVQNIAISSVIAACSIYGAQYWGKRDMGALNNVFCMTLRVNMLISAVFCGLCVFAPVMLMKLFTFDAELIEIGAGYLRIAGWSYLLTGISQCYLELMKLTENAALCARISTGAVLLNIVLNALFIFGLKMGARGAAIATLIARVIELGWSAAATYRRAIPGAALSGLLKHNAQLAKDFFRSLWPLLGAGLFWGVGFTSYTAFVGHLGAEAAAANSVAVVIRDLICCMCNGVGYGGGIMVGNELGAGKLDTGRLYGDRLVILSYVIGFLSMIAMLILTIPVVRMVRLTEGAAQYLTAMMVIMAVYMIGRCVNTITVNGVFTAGGDTLFDLYSLAVAMWGIAVPLAALGTFVFHWPVPVVYACTCLDEVGKIPWVMLHHRKHKWVKDLTRDNAAIADQ